MENPTHTEDGRPFVVTNGEGTDSPLLVPHPQRDGDPVYSCGVVVGRCHVGEPQEPIGGVPVVTEYLTLDRSANLPEKLRRRLRPHWPVIAGAT